MFKTLFLALSINLITGVISYAENWQLTGEPDSRFEELITKIYEKLNVGDKTDVLEALSTVSYEVYIDYDSIKAVSDGRKSSRLKVVFEREQAMEGTDKKLKYLIAETSYDCKQEILWFVRAEIYDNNGELLRDSQTVYVPLDLKELPNTAFERDIWGFVCNYRKAS